MRSLLLLLALQTAPLFAQWEWLNVDQSASPEPEWGHVVRYHTDGGYAMVGNWRNEGVFGPFTFQTPVTNQVCGFVVRYAPDGTVQWGHSIRSAFGQPLETFVYGLAVDDDGNTIVGGHSGDTLLLDDQPVITLGQGGMKNWFIAKFDPAGDLVWITSLAGSTMGRSFFELDTDPAGNVWACGTSGQSVSHLFKYSGADGSVLYQSDLVYGVMYRVDARANGKVLLHGMSSNPFSFGGLSCPLSGALAGGGYTAWTIQLDTAGTAEWYYAPDQGYTGFPGWSTLSMSANDAGDTYVLARHNTRINGDTIAWGNAKGLYLLDPSGVPAWWVRLNASGDLNVHDVRAVPGGGCWVVGDMYGYYDLIDTTMVYNGLFAFQYDAAGQVVRRVFGPQVVNTYSVDARVDQILIGGSQAGSSVFGAHTLTDNWFGAFAARYGSSINTAIESVDGRQAIKLYPNPANDLVNINADASLFGQRAVVEIFDATGTRVHAEQVNTFGSLQPLNLSPEWVEGLYLVMVRVEGQSPRAARVVVKR